MTPMARNICTCAVLATSSFNFVLPTYFAFFKDWCYFGNLQKIGKFLKLGVVLILRYLLTDLFLIQTKLALV